MSFSEIMPAANLLAFATFFGIGALSLAAAVFAYTRITPHKEFALIREGNLAAALSLAGTTLGFALPMAAVISNSTFAGEAAAWFAVALLVQLCAYAAVRVVVPGISQQITEGKLSAGTFLGTCSLAVGVLNAAAMNG